MQKPLAEHPQSRLELKYSTAVLDAYRVGRVAGLAELVSHPSGRGRRKDGARGWIPAGRDNRISAALAFTMASMVQVAKNSESAARAVADIMTSRILRTSAAFVLGTMLLAGNTLARAQASEPASPYGGTVAEGIIARVNDQIITQSDYDRAMKEMDDEARQKGATLQQISAGHKDLLRSLIDQQLWLSKGKELSINGET